MKKSFSLLLMALLTTMGMRAQMIAYDVTTATSELTELTGATIVDLQGTTGTDLSGLALDADGNMEFNTADELKGFPIGFNFNYNGQMMTHFLINTDLKLQLSAKETITTDFHKKDNMVAYYTTEGIHDVIGISPREGVYGLDDTQISYTTTGSEGNRVLTVEYKNIDFGNGGGWGTENEYCGTKATIQFRLYEQSGNIEMQVSGMKPTEPGRYNFMRVGILGSSKDFVQVQAWDGSVVSARDNSISYSATSYPVDGTVYTFAAPEPCVTPLVAPSNIVLTSTTTQISGTFDAVTADKYLVLATTEEALSEKPVDGTKYAAGNELGNARIIAIVDRGEFYGVNDMAQGTYNVFIIPFNSLCMDGPLYCAEAGKATIALKPAAPAALAISNIDKTSLTVSATANEAGSTIVIAMTDKAEINSSDQVLENGVFGTPTGTYSVGDEIEGGGKIIYVGSTTEAVNLSDLTAGTAYYFRAWSADGNGGYSSEYLDALDITVSELPWEFPWMNYGDFAPVGWSFDEDGVWSDNSRAAYFYNQINSVGEEGYTDAWAETSWIELGADGTTVMLDLAGTQRSGWMQSAWTLGDDEYVAVQVTTDDENFTEVLKITNADVESMSSASFTSFSKRFSDFAGQKARVRLFIHRTTMGQTQIANFKLAGSTYGIVGTIPGLTWDNDLIMSPNADNKNIYTVTLDVTIDELPAEAYEYKLRANGSWDGYQLPAEGNQSWMPAETGEYTLVFTADIAANTLSLSAQHPFSVSFDNKGNWTDVYAYAFSYDGENVIEYSGAWPGTKVEVSGSFFNRSWTYDFTAEQQPQYIIWSNGTNYEEYGEEKEQTDDLVFVNGKKYSYYPEITSVQLSGNFGATGATEWTTIDLTIDEWDAYYEGSLDLSGQTDDKEFKLVINGGGDESDNWGGWIGSNNVTIGSDTPEGWVVMGETDGSNMTLKHSTTGYKTYHVVATWQSNKTYYEGWTLYFVGDETTDVSGVRANAAQKQTIHNLKGQLLQKQQRGINIVDGKKVTVK